MCSRMSSEAEVKTADSIDKKYITFFALGDLGTNRHGRKIRVSVSTTHRAQLLLVNGLFEKACHPIIYPCRTRSGYCWRIVCDLDDSYSYLLNRREHLCREDLEKDSLFYAALSGFTDAEGHIAVRDARGKTRVVFGLSNRNKAILELFKQGLGKRGMSVGICKVVDQWKKDYYLLSASGLEAIKILSELRLRHEEKVNASRLAEAMSNLHWSSAAPVYRSFRNEIRVERDRFVKEAEVAYTFRQERRQLKKQIFDGMILSARKMKERGHSNDEIALASKRSSRTVYRWLQKTGCDQ